jgi:hypothetical protein
MTTGGQLLEPPLTQAERDRTTDLSLFALFKECRVEELPGLAAADLELLARVRRRGELERQHRLLYRLCVPRSRWARFLIVAMGSPRTYHRQFRRVRVRPGNACCGAQGAYIGGLNGHDYCRTCGKRIRENPGARPRT